LPVGVIRPNPLQPRKLFDDNELHALAGSIARSGVLQPIAVRTRDGSYEIIAGERRWRAAKLAGLARVPVVVRTADDEQMLELALIENIQREDLNPIDRAQAYREFCTRFQMRPEDLAERLGEDRSTVANYLRLLDLPPVVRELVASKRLSAGHARCLLAVPGDDRRIALAEAAAKKDLSVRVLEEMVRFEKDRLTTERGKEKTPRSAHTREMEQRFEQAVRTKVTIHEGKRKGTGRIVIEYYSLDDFERIAEGLGVKME